MGQISMRKSLNLVAIVRGFLMSVPSILNSFGREICFFLYQGYGLLSEYLVISKIHDSAD